MAVDNTKLVFNALTGNFDLVQDVTDLATTTDLSAYIPLTQKAAVNGVATLNGSGLIPNNQLPAISITDTYVVASQAAMLALSAAETGDVAVRTDLSKTFILKGTTFSVLADWQELLTPTDAVQSVNGQTGIVSLDTDDVPEGSTNLYYTNARFDTQLATKTTSNLAEGTNLYYTDARVNTLVTPTVDYVNRQLKQSTFIAANWDSIGFDMRDAVNSNNGRIANISFASFAASGTNTDMIIRSNRAFTIAAAGTATISTSSSKVYNLMYSVLRNGGGNESKGGMLYMAKEATNTNTNASLVDTGTATNVSMNDVVFSINASGNLLITNNTAFTVDVKVGLFQL